MAFTGCTAFMRTRIREILLSSSDARVGLVDFGCVKRFDPKFVALYGELPHAALHGERKDYMRLLKALRIAGPDIGPEVEEEMFQVFHETGQWLGRLYREEYFDFRANGDFIASGKENDGPGL